jgi:hypothetical protein
MTKNTDNAMKVKNNGSSTVVTQPGMCGEEELCEVVNELSGKELRDIIAREGYDTFNNWLSKSYKAPGFCNYTATKIDVEKGVSEWKHVFKIDETGDYFVLRASVSLLKEYVIQEEEPEQDCIGQIEANYISRVEAMEIARRDLKTKSGFPLKCASIYFIDHNAIVDVSNKKWWQFWKIDILPTEQAQGILRYRRKTPAKKQDLQNLSQQLTP